MNRVPGHYERPRGHDLVRVWRAARVNNSPVIVKPVVAPGRDERAEIGFLLLDEAMKQENRQWA